MCWYRLKFLVDNSVSNDCYTMHDAIEAAKIERAFGHRVIIIRDNAKVWL